MSKSDLKRSEEELSAFKAEALDALREVEQGLVSINIGRKTQENFETVCRYLHAIHAGAKVNGLSDLSQHINNLFSLMLKVESDKTHRSDGIYFILQGCREARKYFAGEKAEFKTIASLNEAAKKINKDILDWYRDIFAHVKSATGSKGLVMAVDDDPDIGLLMQKQLEDCQFDVEVFDSGEKLLSRLSSQTPDLILSDYNMPGYNGLDLMKKVHETYPEIPFLFVSACLTKEVVLEALKQGAYGFVEKPVDEIRLVLMIETAIARDRATKLINRSINFLKYNFAELTETLSKQGKAALLNSLRLELEDISRQQKKLNSLSMRAEPSTFKKIA